MRLRRLQVQRYGHFVDAVIDLPGDGLQVIHGHNEAGKSTLLQFIRELLFGFGERNKYSFGDGKLEGSGLLEFADHQALELKRRKGRPDALSLTRLESTLFERATPIEVSSLTKEKDRLAARTGIPESILEADLQRLLGGANAQLFQNVFAFGLSELASGEESLRIEAVQNALHGSGSSGTTNPQKILDQFNKESDAIFKKNGKLQVVTVLCKEIKDGLAELKKKTTKTDTFLQLKREFETARQTAERFAEELSQVRREQSRVKKLVTAYPLWRELLALQDKRSQYGAAPHLGTDARQKFDKLVDDLKRHNKDTAKLEREIQSAETELAGIPAQTEWLELRAQIEQARELIKSVQDARRDLPLLETELTSTSRHVELGLRDVIHDWTVDQLREFRCDKNQRFQCEELIELKRQLEAEAIRLSERESDLQKSQAEAVAESDSIGQIPDVSRLQALVARQADSLAREADIERMSKEEAKLSRAIVTQIRKLTPPLPSGATDVAQLPVPPVEEILVHQHAITSAQERVTASQRSLDEAIARCEQLEHELQGARGSHLDELPNREGLKQRRTERDAQWQLIRQQFVDGRESVATNPSSIEAATAPAGANLPDSFQSALAGADRYADALFDNAALVTKQEHVTLAQKTAENKRLDLLRFQDELQQAQETWKQLWLACGFIPLDPSTMLAWQATHEAILDACTKRDDLQDELTRLKAKSAEFQAELAAELPDFAGNIQAGLNAAQQRIAQSQQLTQELKNTQKNFAKLSKSADLIKHDRAKYQTRWTDFTARWQAWLTAFQFAPDWQPEHTLETVNRLQNLQNKLESIPNLEIRIAAIRKRLSEFDPLVQSLCETLAPEWKSLPTDVAARSLDDRLQSAITTQQRRSELARDLAKNQNKLADLHQQQEIALKQRSEWLSLAGVETDPEFVEQVERAEAIRELERQVLAKQQQLDVARDLEVESVFLQHLEELDYTASKQTLEELEVKLNTLADQERQANQEKGARENELSKLDGSSAAAELQGQITNRRAALANAVDRYAPLLFAQELLQQTLKRFERESQPEMLGEVSRLFAAMTGDRYVRVERPRDLTRPLLVYRPDGMDLEPSDLSMGTREQLYLAIRLAYVLHYCTRAESLPVVLDDVLANFDPGRTRRTLEALGQITDRVQVLLFTCHPHVVELAQSVFPDLKPVAVPSVVAAAVS